MDLNALLSSLIDHFTLVYAGGCVTMMSLYTCNSEVHDAALCLIANGDSIIQSGIEAVVMNPSAHFSR